MRVLFAAVFIFVLSLLNGICFAESTLDEAADLRTSDDVPRFEYDLTNQDVLNYIKATDQVEHLYKSELSALKARFDASLQIAAPLDESGYIALYRYTYNGLATLDEKNILDRIYFDAGFSNVTGNWPELSDRIFSSYLKLQAERGASDILNSLSDALLAQLPAQQVSEIRQLKVMFIAAENLTSNRDLAIARPHLSELEIAMKDMIGG